jgi:F-type H+-transporting ATPase subunit b
MAAHPPVDPHAIDAGHGAADAAHGGAATFPPFDPLTFGTQLFWFAVTFGLLYFVVSRFVLPKVGGVLEKRAGTIAGDLDQATQKSAAAEEARAAMERAVAKARADARGLIDAARADVMAKLNAEQEAAEKRLTDRIATAEASVSAARKRALAEVPALADQLARDIADKIAPVAAPARQRVAGDAQ